MMEPTEIDDGDGLSRPETDFDHPANPWLFGPDPDDEDDDRSPYDDLDEGEDGPIFFPADWDEIEEDSLEI